MEQPQWHAGPSQSFRRLAAALDVRMMLSRDLSGPTKADAAANAYRPRPPPARDVSLPGVGVTLDLISDLLHFGFVGDALEVVARRVGALEPSDLLRGQLEIEPSRQSGIISRSSSRASRFYQHEVEQLIDSAPELLATLPPLDALRRWTTDLVSAMRKRQGLGDALSPSAHQSITEQTYGPVIAAITQLLEAGKHDGTIRADAEPTACARNLGSDHTDSG